VSKLQGKEEPTSLRGFQLSTNQFLYLYRHLRATKGETKTGI